MLSPASRVAAAVLLGAGGVAASAASASAHAVLRGSTPRPGSTLTAAPGQVVVTFDDTVSAPAFVTVTGPGGRVDAGPAQVRGDQVSVPLKAGAASGAYQVAYRVVSDDGHPVEGTFAYTLQLAAAASPTSSPAGTATSPAAAAPSASAPTPGPDPADAANTPAAAAALTGSEHGQHWFAGIAGGAMVVAGAGALFWERRRRGDPGAEAGTSS